MLPGGHLLERTRVETPHGLAVFRSFKSLKGVSLKVGVYECGSRSDASQVRPIRRWELPAESYFSMFLRASFKAASGVASPFVAVSNAAFKELQSLPI